MDRRWSIGRLVLQLFLFPGDLACDALGVHQADNRDLVRMLVNSLVWAMVSVIAVVIAVGRSPG